MAATMQLLNMILANECIPHKKYWLYKDTKLIDTFYFHINNKLISDLTQVENLNYDKIMYKLHINYPDILAMHIYTNYAGNQNMIYVNSDFMKQHNVKDRIEGIEFKYDNELNKYLLELIPFNDDRDCWTIAYTKYDKTSRAYVFLSLNNFKMFETPYPNFNLNEYCKKESKYYLYLLPHPTLEDTFIIERIFTSTEELIRYKES